MNRNWLVLCLLAGGVVFSRAESSLGLTVWFPDGTGLDIRTESSGGSLPLSTTGSDVVPPGSPFHRIVFDKSGKLLLAYDIEARKSGANTYQVRIRPVERHTAAVYGWGKRDELPTISTPRDFPPLRVGDAMSVDIFYRPASGEKIYDVLKVVGDRPASARKPPAGKFSLEEPSVIVSGKTIREPQNFWMVGRGLRVHLPGRGDYYLALSPAPGYPFQPSGWVDHNTLRFHAGSDLVEIVGKSNALQNSEYGTVWVYADPDTRPQSARPVDFSCGDDVAALIKMMHEKSFRAEPAK